MLRKNIPEVFIHAEQKSRARTKIPAPKRVKWSLPYRPPTPTRLTTPLSKSGCQYSGVHATTCGAGRKVGGVGWGSFVKFTFLLYVCAGWVGGGNFWQTPLFWGIPFTLSECGGGGGVWKVGYTFISILTLVPGWSLTIIPHLPKPNLLILSLRGVPYNHPPPHLWIRHSTSGEMLTAVLIILRIQNFNIEICF